MTGEHPYLCLRGDFADAGCVGANLAVMTICVECQIGKEGGHEGVKLERQVLVAETGVELQSEFSIEESLVDTGLRPASLATGPASTTTAAEIS